MGRKSLNFVFEVFIFTPGDDVYFALVAKKDSSEDRLRLLYGEVRGDL
jgi:hypothetical protein